MKNLFLLLFFTSFYSFSQDSLQVQKPKISVIELDKIKVVYRGIENPITIAVPKNVKSFTVSGNGVSSTNEIGKYIIKPGVGNEMIIKVEMVLLDNSIVVEEHVYQIINISMHRITLNGEFSSNKAPLEFNISEIENAEIDVIFPNVIFLDFITNGFNLKVPGYPTLVITGNKITNEAFELIKKARNKDIIVISEIKGKYYGYNGFIKNPSPFIFKIID